MKENVQNNRILIIDDNEAIHQDLLKVLGSRNGNKVNVNEEETAIFGSASRALERQFEIDSAYQGQEGLEKVRQALQRDMPYAIAFVDMRMPPGWDGIETVQRIWQEDPNIQIAICTAYSDYSWRDIIEKLGETDRFLILKKPFDTMEARQMAGSLTRKWGLLNNLEHLVKEQTREVVEGRDLTVFALAKLAESRDPETGEHLERMRDYSQILAEQLAKQGPYKNQITEQFLTDLYRSSPLHDIGKVGIPDTILLKPGQLSTDEFEVMRRHTLIGEEAIKAIVEHSGSGSFLAMSVKITRSHHERFDGSGYPDGLVGQDIPLPARIVALADVFDAITSVRVYKSASDPVVARSMIENQVGKHFDPVIVEAFNACWDDFIEVGGFINNSKLELAECVLSSDVRR